MVSSPRDYALGLAEALTGGPVVVEGYGEVYDVLLKVAPPAALTPAAIHKGHQLVREGGGREGRGRREGEEGGGKGAGGRERGRCGKEGGGEKGRRGPEGRLMGGGGHHLQLYRRDMKQWKENK